MEVNAKKQKFKTRRDGRKERKGGGRNGLRASLMVARNLRSKGFRI